MDTMEDSTESSYRVYKKRWLVLASVSLINLSNAMNWVTFTPIADHTGAYFGVSSGNVNMLSIIYLIVSLPVGFIVAWLFDTLGIVLGLWIGAWTNFLGTVLRYLSAVIHVKAIGQGHYWLLLFGQGLCAFAQAFGLFAPTKVAALWFAHDQRATANMLSSMANPVGIALGVLVPPFLVPSRDTEALLHDMPRMLWIFILPAAVCVAVTLFVVKNKPPSPPSPSAEEVSEPFLKGLKKLVRNRKYHILLLMWGCGLGVFNTLITLMQQILCPFGYSDELVGIGGAVMCCFGLVGSGITCFYVDRTKNFIPTVKICYIGASLGIIWFVLSSFQRHMEGLILSSLGFFGLFGYGLLPIILELGVEVTYPVAEATSAGMLWLAGQVVGIVFLVLAQLPVFQSKVESPETVTVPMPTPMSNSTVPNSTDCTHDLTNAGLLVAGMATVATILFTLCFRAPYRRVAAEERITNADVQTIHEEEEDLFEHY